MADRSARRTVAGVAAAMVMLMATIGPAAAQSVTGNQLRALAERAVDDQRALAELRAVREVDGRPVDVGQALSGAEGPVLAARLRTLAGTRATGDEPVASDAARRDAEMVLEGRRFRPSAVPRPFKGLLTTMGRWFEPVVEPLASAWARIADNLGAQLALVAVVFAGAVAVSVRLVGRRSPRALDRSRPFGVDARGLDPDDLDRDATAAEQAGELDRAVRLRFVAGVLRLDEAGAITYRSSMTTGQLKAGLPSASFAELAAAFDEIVYGGRPADASDVRAARATWPRVLAEAGR